jgi:hypothetical protein
MQVKAKAGDGQTISSPRADFQDRVTVEKSSTVILHQVKNPRLKPLAV